jgi:hypothetical protein
MKDLLKTYQETVNDIFLRFGYENGYGEIDVKINVVWISIEDEEVRWLENEQIYCNETMHMTPLRFENYVMFYVDNGCGERFYQIFDENLRNDSEEFWDSYE